MINANADSKLIKKAIWQFHCSRLVHGTMDVYNVHVASGKLLFRDQRPDS